MKLRPRFSLRTLLLIVAAAAVICWAYWVAWPRWEDHYDQQQFVESVKRIKVGMGTNAACQTIHTGPHCKVDLYGDHRFFDHEAELGYLYIWPNAIYCVHYVAPWTKALGGDGWGPIVSVELFKLKAMPPNYQSQYALDFGTFLLDGAQNNPGFDYELIYADPPQHK